MTRDERRLGFGLKFLPHFSGLMDFYLIISA